MSPIELLLLIKSRRNNNASAVVESLTVTENGVYTPDSGVDGFSTVTVEVPDSTPTLQDKTVTITTNTTTTIQASEGYDGLGEVEVVTNIPQPSGSISITENNTYDVAQYASAIVNVPTGGGNAQYTSGHFTQIDTYTNVQKMPIAHGLSATPKYFAIWRGDIDNTTRHYQGNVYIADMIIRADNDVGYPAPVFITNVNGASSSTQTLVPGTTNNPVPDDTYIYLCIGSTANPIPAGTEIYWEAATW